MLEKCVNPAMYFALSLSWAKKDYSGATMKKFPAALAKIRPRYFGLCAFCSKLITLKINEHGEIIPVPVPGTIHGLGNAIDITIREQKYRISLHPVRLAIPNNKMTYFEPRHEGKSAITSAVENIYEVYSH